MTRVSSIVSLGVRTDDDVVAARHRARVIAAALGFDVQQQTRLATALSELVRNVQQYATEGRVAFELEERDRDRERFLTIRVADRGPGIADVETILSGQYRSPTGMGVGLVGARRLSDEFALETKPGKGTTVTIRKRLTSALDTRTLVTHATAAVAGARSTGLSDELRQQNHDLMATLEDLEQHRLEIERVNTELEETNRGVVALYAELDDRARELKRASESKSRFLSMISHELRTPLTSVLNLSRLLLDRVDGDLTVEQERQITLIRNSVASLTEMVNDLLDLAKIEAGKTTLRLTRISVAELFAGLRAVFRPVMSSPFVTLTFDEVDPALVMCTDEGKVTQVVRNFVSNAVKFTEHGEIRVSATTGDGDTVRFAVADTGIGIAPEHLDHIFEEFGQVDSAAQRKVKGTGLGLSLARTIADLLGGAVGVESELGKGSTFWIELPRVDARSAPDCDDVAIEIGSPAEEGPRD
jgi:signal transduction histidine kinase